MKKLVVLAVLCFGTTICVDVSTKADDTGCVIDLDCEECLPDSMPLITSHNATGSRLELSHDESAVLWCGAGRFLAATRAMLVVRCSHGRYRLPDGTTKHLLELGCQQDVIEDVLHPVSQCGGGYQGRAYRVSAVAGGSEHLATLCYDGDRAVVLRAHVAPSRALHLPPHQDARAPLSLFANFNEMFDARNRRDAERLFSDNGKLNHRFKELLAPFKTALGEQTLMPTPILSARFFRPQERRASKLASNTVLAWRGVARGNWHHLHEDVEHLARRLPQLLVWAGTHGQGSVRGDSERVPLIAGTEGRFPVPKYLWTVVFDPSSNRGLAVIVLNDPLVSVSEVRDAVFCESSCGRASWLKHLTRQRRYEAPALGLAFCCFVHDIARIKEFPQELTRNVSRSLDGALYDVV